MNLLYLLPPLFAFVINVILLVLVLRKDRRSSVHRIFSLLLFSAALWGLAIFAMRASPDTEHALLWEMVALPFIFATPVLYYHFCLTYTKVERKKSFILAAYLFLVSAVVLSLANLFISRMELRDYGYAPVLNPLAYPFLVFGFCLMLMGLYNLVKAFRASRVYEDRNRLFYIILASIFPLLGAAIDVFPHTYPAGIFGNIIFCTLVSVAILRYHLLDIHIVIRKGIAYLLMSALVAIPFVGIIIGVSYGLKGQFPLWGYILTLIALTFALQPGWRKVQAWIEERFYRSRYVYIKKLQEFSQGATGLSDIGELAYPLLNTLAPALETDGAYLFLPSFTGDFTLIACTKPNHRTLQLSLARDSPFIHFLEHHQDFLHRRNFDVFPQLQAISARERNLLFGELQGELFAPIRIREELVGVLTLGPKSSRQLYSTDDLQILASTLPQLAISLDNVRLYEMEKQRARESALLLELGAIVTSELDMNKVYQTFIDKLRDILLLDYAHIALIEPHEGKLRFVAVSPETKQICKAGESIPLPGTPTAWISQHDTLHYEPDLAKKADFSADEGLLESEIRSVVRLPLRTKQSVIGSFDVGSRMPNAYTENNLSLLQQVADQVAIATENSQLYKLEKEARAELERQDKERIELIDTLAHELKTPLTPMMVSLELLPHVTPDSEQFKKMVRGLSHSAQSLNRRVSDLLEFARTQRAKVEIKAGRIDIADAINKVATAILPMLEEKEQKLSIEVPSLPEVRADGDRVEQILHNLLSNAVKFSDRGSLISLRARQIDAYVRVEVEDAASPLSPREQEEVFDPYYRGEKARSTPGLGIGLAICKRLVELQGGKIGVGSDESGNCFFFALPVADFQRDER